uniref:Uncharacterized protein n=1 Tax=Timema poppense TaxID=170557 RepID=A0A7R9H2U4_TIMPO|nr:unnamed protein product [Timema poppensis]
MCFVQVKLLKGTRRNSGDIDVVEEVVPLVAGFGKWQFLMAGMLCFSVIPITWNYHAILFLAPSQQGYVCKYPEGLGFENWRLDDWITLSHPKHKVYSKESPNLEQCHMYKLNYSELVNATESEIDSLPTNQTEIIRCSEFLFFPARYGLTILQKLNLLCEDKSKMVLTEALFRIGLMLGNFIFGRMSDSFYDDDDDDACMDTVEQKLLRYHILRSHAPGLGYQLSYCSVAITRLCDVY